MFNSINTFKEINTFYFFIETVIVVALVSWETGAGLIVVGGCLRTVFPLLYCTLLYVQTQWGIWDTDRELLYSYWLYIPR